MIGKIFRIFGTRAKVVNYDDTSGKYIYKLLINGDFGYQTKEFILENEVKENE